MNDALELIQTLRMRLAHQEDVIQKLRQFSRSQLMNPEDEKSDSSSDSDDDEDSGYFNAYAQSHIHDQMLKVLH